MSSAAALFVAGQHSEALSLYRAALEDVGDDDARRATLLCNAAKAENGDALADASRAPNDVAVQGGEGASENASFVGGSGKSKESLPKLSPAAQAKVSLKRAERDAKERAVKAADEMQLANNRLKKAQKGHAEAVAKHSKGQQRLADKLAATASNHITDANFEKIRALHLYTSMPPRTTFKISRYTDAMRDMVTPGSGVSVTWRSIRQTKPVTPIERITSMLMAPMSNSPG